MNEDEISKKLREFKDRVIEPAMARLENVAAIDAERYADQVSRDKSFRKKIEKSALSFRDQCAIAAMQGMISAIRFDAEYWIRDDATSTAIQNVFDLADAMEAERKKRGAK